MKIQPDTHVLQALRNQSLGWTRALGELIDNALDASAMNITIIAEKRGEHSTISVADDGVGCADMGSMFRLGDHRPHAGTKGLGRFGIGLKDAALWLWGITTVESVRAGRKHTAMVNWERLCNSRDWEIDDPDDKPANSAAPGTRIVFSRAERAMPSGRDLDKLVSELGFIFSPALKRDARIVLRSGNAAMRSLERCGLPELAEVIEGAIEVDGRAAHVHVGVVREGVPNPRSGIHYTHRHRVIIPGSGLGCGDTSTSRIFGWVMLSEQWRLSKNKDEVTDHKEELGQAVYEFIKPILEKADKQAESMDLQGLEAQLTKWLREAANGKLTEREKRENGASDGAVTPRETGRKRGAVKRQPGNRLPGQLDAGRLRVEFDETLDPDDGIGTVDVHGHRVRLAMRHRYVADLRANNNRASLFQLALSLLVHHCVLEPENGQRWLPGLRNVSEDRQFSTMLGKFMQQVLVEERMVPRVQLVA
jgi:hypothetical protein